MSVEAEGFKASPFLSQIEQGLSDKDLSKAAVQAVNAVLIINLKNKDGKDQAWLLDLKNEGSIKKVEGAPPRADVELILKDVDFVKLAEGKANGQKLFMNGKLKVKGNLMKATAIESVFKQLDPRPQSKL